MKKYIILFFAVIVLTGCSLMPKTDVKPTAKPELSGLCLVTADLPGSVNKDFKVSGVVIGDYIKNDWSNQFSIKDKNCRITVEPWAPEFVNACAPEVIDCNPPKMMSQYVGEKVEFTGRLLLNANTQKYYLEADPALGINIIK